MKVKKFGYILFMHSPIAVETMSPLRQRYTDGGVPLSFNVSDRTIQFVMVLFEGFFVIFSSVIFGHCFEFNYQPNIVVLLADDMGFGDLASYGHPSQEWSPIDSMALHGMRFTQFYAADSLCTPSRTAIMTGRYAIRSGMVGGRRVLIPTDVGGLPADEVTIPEMLKMAGYRTGMVGKWHLGINAYNSSDGTHLPENHGFDFVGVNLPLANAWNCDESGYFGKDKPQPEWCFLYNGSRIIQQPFSHSYLTDMLFDGYRYFLDTQDRNQPFFFYFSFPQVHTSLASKITAFSNTSRRGLYGGDMVEMGNAVGNALKELKDRHLQERTFVIFLSDHGPHRELCLFSGETNGMKGGKANSFEGGFRIPAIVSWRGTIENEGRVSNALLSTLDLFPTFARLAGLDLALTFPNLVLDGIERTDVFLGIDMSANDNREIFYYCNKRIMAVRYGSFKVHFYTVRLFNNDMALTQCPGGRPLEDMYMSQTCADDEIIEEVPPLIYNVAHDPMEVYPLDNQMFSHIEQHAREITERQMNSVMRVPDQLGTFNPAVRPCCSPPNCRCNYKSPAQIDNR